MAKVLFAVAAALTLAFLPAAHGANGGTIVVDNDFADCPIADTASIQAGVTMAAAGDLVLVCAGTYAESVTIDAAHSNISVNQRDRSATSSSRARAPPSPTASDSGS
jgi:hypothetical protein